MVPAVVLHLHISVEGHRRDELLAFLRDAREYYEQGADGRGGIRMRLLQDAENENAFIEVFEYDTLEAYQADEQRVAGGADPMMKAVLTKWRSLLKETPTVETYIDLTESELKGDTSENQTQE